MPRLDGYKATAALRRDQGYRGVIIGVTGNALEADRGAFITSGADAVHVKPITSAALAAEIRARVPRSRQLTQL